VLLLRKNGYNNSLQNASSVYDIHKMHQVFMTYLMPATLSWEGLLLLLRRKLSPLLRCDIINELAVAYETVPVYFEIDGQEHNLPVCHCWCSIHSQTNTVDTQSFVYNSLQSLGLLLIDDDCEISDDYIEGMRNLIIGWDDYPLNSKYVRWRIVVDHDELRLIRVEFGRDFDLIVAPKQNLSV
jgi:hypothetical protein